MYKEAIGGLIMKKLTIYQRSVLERRQKGYFQLRYEFIAVYGGKFIYGNENELNNLRLRRPFSILVETRSIKKVGSIIASNKTKKGEWKKDNWTTAYRPVLENVIRELQREQDLEDSLSEAK